jgi:hypothetical protein
MDKPAKPPDRLEGQSAVSSAVCVQDPDEEEEQEEPGDWEELEEYQRQEEDLCRDWSSSCGEEDTAYISEQAVPTARTYACVEVAEALMPSPTKKDPPTARNGRPTASGMSAGPDSSHSRRGWVGGATIGRNSTDEDGSASATPGGAAGITGPEQVDT